MYKVCVAQSFCFFDIIKHIRLDHSFPFAADSNLSRSDMPARYVQISDVNCLLFIILKMYVSFRKTFISFEPGSYDYEPF